jgi:carboxyl-terminal processing protease
MEIAARFADLARVVFRKHSQGPSGATTPYDVTLEPSERKRFNGPVAVLVGPNTVSAGESLALALAAFPQVRLIGRPTRGEVSDAIPKTLPNGWTFTLSTESYLTPDGMVVEARGVQPAELTSASTSTAPEQLWGADLAAAQRWLESPAAR